MPQLEMTDRGNVQSLLVADDADKRINPPVQPSTVISAEVSYHDNFTLKVEMNSVQSLIFDTIDRVKDKIVPKFPSLEAFEQIANELDDLASAIWDEAVAEKGDSVRFANVKVIYRGTRRDGFLIGSADFEGVWKEPSSHGTKQLEGKALASINDVPGEPGFIGPKFIRNEAPIDGVAKVLYPLAGEELVTLEVISGVRVAIQSLWDRTYEVFEKGEAEDPSPDADSGWEKFKKAWEALWGNKVYEVQITKGIYTLQAYEAESEAAVTRIMDAYSREIRHYRGEPTDEFEKMLEEMRRIHEEDLKRSKEAQRRIDEWLREREKHGA